MMIAEVQATGQDAMEMTDSHASPPLKRKASPDNDDGGKGYVQKRTRYDDSDDDDREPPRRRSQSADNRGRATAREEDTILERRGPVAATQEDKKRGRRLFGGLLNTLSQAPSSSQQKRRQEIEKRQRERMHRQEAEDDERRRERLAQLRATRIREQIIFDEEVMRNRHVKKLALARYLQTKAEPKIYYLPWRCIEEELDIIEEQTREAREAVQREEAEFEKRRKWHVERHGVAQRPRPPSPPREHPQPQSPSTAALAPLRDDAPSPKAAAASSPPEMRIDSKPEDAVADAACGVGEAARAEAHHDDTGDVVEHAGEDMVIY